MRPVEVSIVLPVRDAEPHLMAVVDSLRQRVAQGDFRHELWLAEHGSTDRTARVVGQLSAKYPEVEGLCVGGASLGTALRRAIAAARGRFVVCDSLGAGGLDFIGGAVGRLRLGDDVVMGRSDAPGTGDRSLDTYRDLLRWGVGFELMAPGGLIAFRRELVAPIAERCTMDGEGFGSELVIRCRRQGLRVTELAVRLDAIRSARGGVSVSARSDALPPGPRRLRRAVSDLWQLRRALGG